MSDHEPDLSSEGHGEVLEGGRTSGATRVDGTVRKPWAPWTPAVHAVLRHLESAGFDRAPRAFGADRQGRQVLSYLPGHSIGDHRPWPAWIWTDSALAQVGSWMRHLHEVTITFVPSGNATWFSGRPWRPGLVIGHQDAAPWNAVWRDGHLVGFVDWDTAGPSTPERDLALAALHWVPLTTRHTARSRGFTAHDDRSRRLHLLLDAYGYHGDRVRFASAVSERARINVSVIRRLAAGGDPVYEAMAPMADDLEQAADETDALPPEFWTPGSRTQRRNPAHP